MVPHQGGDSREYPQNMFSWRNEKTIALDKALFFNQKVPIFFLFLDENICCGYSLEAPCQGTSNEYPQHTIFHLITAHALISSE